MKNNFKTQFKFKMSSNENTGQHVVRIYNPYVMTDELNKIFNPTTPGSISLIQSSIVWNKTEYNRVYTIIKKFPSVIDELYSSSNSIDITFKLFKFIDSLKLVNEFNLSSPFNLNEDIAIYKKFLKDKELTQEVKYVIFKFKQIKDSTF